MAIELVINGYFRSGSTMMWDLVKKSNPEMLCMYEPCHPELFRKIITEDPNKCFELHKMAVWADYHKLERSQIEKLRKLHHMETIVLEFEKWQSYFDYIGSLSKHVFLQPNRAHFILEDMYRRYSCPIVHLVRNPLDTLVSFGLVDKLGNPVPDIPSMKSGFAKKAKLVMSELSKSKTVSDAAYLLNFYMSARSKGHSVSNYSYKENYTALLGKGIVKKPDYEPDNLDIFLLVWASVNLHAKKQTERIGKKGACMNYEDIISKPKETLGWFEGHGIGIDLSLIKIRNTSVREFPTAFRGNVIQKLDKLGLVEDVRYILGDEYFNKSFLTLHE